MIRPDDCSLDMQQLATVKRHADELLRNAGALRRFPTPVDEIMCAAKLVVLSDQELNENFLRQLAQKAAAGVRAGVELVKSALSKVLGLFDAQERLVLIDNSTPPPRVPFVKLHEAGHGSLPHQSKMYRLMHDCELTLDPAIGDLFEREANVFASEVLFQGEVFCELAREQDFSIDVPMALAEKFGGSHYATFRRYVTVNSAACCVVVLEPVGNGEDGKWCAEVRRVVMSESFKSIFDGRVLCETVNKSHPLSRAVPHGNRRLVRELEVELVDRNGDTRVCLVEAFNTRRNILVLVRNLGKQSRFGIVVPGVAASWEK